LNQSHAGSGKQTRAVLDGLGADVVTLGIPCDIDVLAKAGLLKADWRKQFPDNSTPYTSTIVFLVRRGNPKNIHDWDDLIRPGISVITPNPQTSAGGRWNYLAAWGWVIKNAGDQAKAIEFITKLYHAVPVLDTGARGSTTTFVQRKMGDVLIIWENEAYLARKEFGENEFDVVYPSQSIRAEPPVAVVDKNVEQHHNRELAEAYLNFLYTDEAQELIAQNYYRPRSATVAEKYASHFPRIELFTFEEVFGDWDAVQKEHFAEGGIFDRSR